MGEQHLVCDMPSQNGSQVTWTDWNCWHSLSNSVIVPHPYFFGGKTNSALFSRFGLRVTFLTGVGDGGWGVVVVSKSNKVISQNKCDTNQRLVL